MLKKILIQVFILILIIIIFFFTYQKYFKKNLESEISITSDKKIEETTVAFDIKYLAKDSRGNRYEITADKSIVDQDNPDILNLVGVKAIFNSNNQNEITIKSINAKYDKANLNTEFFNSVELINKQNVINSDNLDLNFDKNIAIIYNNVKVKNNKSTMKADKVSYDLIKKVLKINMFDKDSDIEIKSNN